MTPPDDVQRELDRVVKALADGGPVDWATSGTSSLDERERGMIRALELVDRLNPRIEEEAPAPALGHELPDGTVVPGAWSTLRLQRVIGRGAFGTVFEARDLLLDQLVALKVLHPGAGPIVGRLIEEGRRLARLRHPNIVTVMCIDQHEDLIGLRMELLDGPTLAEHLETHGRLTESEVLDIGAQLCLALGVAHREGIVHRDIKAHNVIRDASGRVVLMDLGAGADFDGANPGVTRGVIGTPLYMAPEVLAGDAATPRSDLYSLGVLLYHLLSGGFPHPATTLEKLRATVAADAGIPLGASREDLSPGTLAIIERALARSPGDRFDDVSAMGEALRAQSAELAAARESARPPHNLPQLLNVFVGREREIETISAALAKQRVVTLTGAGGCGKTRTALEAAWQLLDGYTGGAHLVELAAIEDASRVAEAILGALEIKGSSREPAVDTLSRVLANRELLIILDNCEQISRGAAEVVSTLVGSTARVRVLVTSREALRVPGERIVPIEPLAVPREEDDSTLETLSSVESVALFLERAEAGGAVIERSRDALRALARITRRLDGIPLAIELAAVQTASQPLEEIARRLTEEFLNLGDRTAASLPHHRTLETLVGWSYDLLSRAEKALLRRASVFVGSWSLEAAEAVCSGDLVDAADVSSLHFQLTTKSLIQRLPGGEPGTARARYRMLETIRAFAGARLAAEDDGPVVKWRHRDHFEALGREILGQTADRLRAGWHDRVRVDAENFRGALRTALREPVDAKGAVALCRLLERSWRSIGHWSEARAIFEEVLALPELLPPSRERAYMLLLEGSMAHLRADYSAALSALEEGLPAAREHGSPFLAAEFLTAIGTVHYNRGDLERARAYFGEALELSRSTNAATYLTALANLAAVEGELGNLDAAARHLEECAMLQRRSGNHQGLAHALENLAVVKVNTGDPTGGEYLLEEALELRRALAEDWRVAVALTNLGHVARLRGDTAKARARYVEGLPKLRALGAWPSIATALEGCAGVEVVDRFPRRAARLVGAAEAIRESTGAGLTPSNRESLERTLAQAEKLLAPEPIAEERAAGRAMSRDAAVEFALERESRG